MRASMISESNSPLRQFLNLRESSFNEDGSKLSPRIALPSMSLKSSSSMICRCCFYIVWSMV